MDGEADRPAWSTATEVVEAQRRRTAADIAVMRRSPPDREDEDVSGWVRASPVIIEEPDEA